MNNSIIALNANGSILSTTNDYKYVQISPNITTSPPSNPNTNTNNNNSNATVALPLDQNQLLQITQLMNEMQASANQNLNDSLTLTESNIIVQQPAQQQQQQNQQVYTNLMEFVMSSPTHQNQPQAQPQTPNQQAQNNTNNNNNIIFSPNSIIKLEQQIQFPTAQPIQQQIIIPQQQSDNTQVHTIMLNGQPALFIPASSALSSNLLCELLMNNNVATLGTNSSGNNNGQTFELSNQPIQLHLPMQLPIHMQQGDNNNSGNQQFVILNANGTFSSPIKLGNELGGNAGSSGDKLATNESSNSVNSTKPVSGKKKNAKKDAAGSNGLNSNASSNSNSQTGMELEDIFNENAEKKKRKACDCPNCYR